MHHVNVIITIVIVIVVIIIIIVIIMIIVSCKTRRVVEWHVIFPYNRIYTSSQGRVFTDVEERDTGKYVQANWFSLNYPLLYSLILLIFSPRRLHWTAILAGRLGCAGGGQLGDVFRPSSASRNSLLGGLPRFPAA